MRALYGSDGTRNGAHGSDLPASAEREIKFFFPDLQLSTEAGAAAPEDAKVHICDFAGLRSRPFAFCRGIACLGKH